MSPGVDGPPYRTVLSATAAGAAALGWIAGLAALGALARTDMRAQEPFARPGAVVGAGGGS